MFKKAISALLACTMLITMTTTVFAADVTAINAAQKNKVADKPVNTYTHISGDTDLRNTQADYISNKAAVSPVQQFAYKNEGLAYAYVKADTLKITTPSKKLSIPMRYPLLGDVVSDNDGNFYVVWGKINTIDTPTDTVFITKYSPEGEYIDTTGFEGVSTPWDGDDSAKTKVPFDAGTSVSVIANGILVNYHGKKRYDGHQSDNVIAVDISDMSPYEFPNDTYSGHSFDQSVIYSELAQDFVFASHGDAYSRGFRVNLPDGRYGDDSQTIFHFFLESNANYNMYLVNKTYAQLGGLAETSRGVALVGASAKSISEAAKTEHQNLFVQIFDPLSINTSSPTFEGGIVREGAMSFDINDNSNSPLESVSDYGVIWLTNYTDRSVIAPQVVVADDRIVILWTENINYVPQSFYMVLSAEGNIITPKTSLGAMRLNSNEQPIYQNGSVYWAYAYNNELKVASIKP